MSRREAAELVLIEQNVKIGKLEQENLSLNNLAKQLEAELFETRDSLSFQLFEPKMILRLFLLQ